MRIATYNVEWFDALFDDAGQPLADDAWSARRDVTPATSARMMSGAVMRRPMDRPIINKVMNCPP